MIINDDDGGGGGVSQRRRLVKDTSFLDPRQLERVIERMLYEVTMDLEILLATFLPPIWIKRMRRKRKKRKIYS